MSLYVLWNHLLKPNIDILDVTNVTVYVKCVFSGYANTNIENNKVQYRCSLIWIQACAPQRVLYPNCNRHPPLSSNYVTDTLCALLG